MPTISSFSVSLFRCSVANKPTPRHFHALYAEFEVEIDIRTLEVLLGRLLESGAVTWPNGADLDPAWLYDQVAGG